MASQTKSAFAAEGTQYGIDSSYFVLDTVPGAGNVLQGPITITGALTTTGTTVSQGNLAAPNVATSSVVAPAGLALTASAGNVAIQANGGNVSMAGGSLVAAMTGAVALNSGPASAASLAMLPAGQIGLSTLGPSTLIQLQSVSSGSPGAPAASLLLNANGNVALSGSNTTTITTPNLTTVNAQVLINPKTGMGTPGAPRVIATNETSFQFDMEGNKLFIQTTGTGSGSVGVVYIKLPFNSNAPDQPPFVFVTDGDGVLLTNAFSVSSGLYYNPASGGIPSITPNAWFWRMSVLGLIVRTNNILCF